jgi:hypothetical protein
MVPNSTIDKIGLTSLRFGVNARNPFTVLAKKATEGILIQKHLAALPTMVTV